MAIHWGIWPMFRYQIIPQFFHQARLNAQARTLNSLKNDHWIWVKQSFVMKIELRCYPAIADWCRLDWSTQRSSICAPLFFRVPFSSLWLQPQGSNSEQFWLTSVFSVWRTVPQRRTILSPSSGSQGSNNRSRMEVADKSTQIFFSMQRVVSGRL